MKMSGWAEKAGTHLSERDLIRFDNGVLVLLCCSSLLFIFLVIFSIHGSSLPMWNKMVPGDNDKEGLIWGRPKSIRSDEYAVGTPFALSQALAEPSFPLENSALGEGKVPLFMNIPVKHISSFFKPQTWGYFFLDPERGFSFFWNFKLLSVFLSFFFLLMLLTSNNFVLSLLGSFWLLFSSYLQWWFSTTLPEMVASFCVIFVSIIYLVSAEKKTNIIIGAAFLLIFGLNFVFLLYPAWQIPLAYLLAFLLIGHMAKSFSWSRTRQHLSLRLLCLSLVAALALATLYVFYQDGRETIRLVMGTVYPGSRRTVGGGGTWAQYFSGYYNQLMGAHHYLKLFSNASSASNFVLFYPLVGAAIVRNFTTRRKNDILQLCLLAYILLATWWISIGFPATIARLTLWSLTTSSRPYLAIGVASIILCILFLDAKEPPLRGDKAILCVTLSILTLLILYGLHLATLPTQAGGFFSCNEVLIVSVIVTIAAVALLMKQKALFGFMVFAMVVLPGLCVNPISIGLGPIANKELSKILTNWRKENPTAKWAVYGNRFLPDFFIATGADVFNGVKYAPQLKYLERLDRNHANMKIYNRYAHIALREPEGSDGGVKFKLVQEDCYDIYIDPCSPELQQMGVTNIAFDYKPSDNILRCAQPMTSGAINNVWLYKYRRGGSYSTIRQHGQE